MFKYFKLLSFFCLALIYSCGGGGNENNPVSIIPPMEKSGPIFSVSTTNLTITGKQFAVAEPPKRIEFTYLDSDVSRVDIPHRFSNPDIFNGDIFKASMNTAQKFVDISSANTDLEGGTYVEDMIITPSLQSGGDGDPVTVTLTLIQEPTTPITSAPESITNIIAENGPVVRTKIMLNAGNVIRWEVGAYRYQAETVDAVTSEPTSGTGSQEIDILVTPTPLLVDELRQQAGEGLAQISFQDIDNPGNVWIFNVGLSLDE